MRSFDKDKFVADCLAQVGKETRWRHQGKDPDVGLDCLGLPRWAFLQQFEMPPDLEKELLAYHRKPDGQKLLNTLKAWFDEVPREAMDKADLVSIYDRGVPGHIGVACDSEYVVEAYASGLTMKVVYWKLGTWRRLGGFFRFPETGEKAELWK